MKTIAMMQNKMSGVHIWGFAKTSLLAALLIYSFTASSRQLSAKLDSVIRTEFNDSIGPGGVFLLARNGVPFFEKSYGMANLELKVPLRPEFVFQIGSMTKQFTAIAILQLEEQGKLKVTDPVSKFVPDFPSGETISIHHLLTHTSGIKDFTKMKSLQDIAQKEMSPKMMVDFFKNEPADFKPGEKFEYNNSGYVLLGYIVELASGQTYEQYVRKNIFEKADMTKSGYANDRQLLMNRTDGYHLKSNGYVNKTVINYSVPFASGSLTSTVDDLLKWQNALNRNTVLSAAASQKAFTRYKLNNGSEFTYGYGWHLKDMDGTATREHGGSIFGFKSMAVYIPEFDIYVVGLSNCDCNSPTQIVRSMAALALENLKSNSKEQKTKK
ncbi:MAG: serine hydrolase domain-containing protein [Chitinophagaceae bacterium]